MAKPKPPVTSKPARPRRQRGGPVVMPWKWITLSFVVYAIAGILLAAFSPPVWVWPIALAGTLMQAMAMAGPKALLLLPKWQVRWTAVLSCLGTAGLMVALAIAIGHSGTDDIDALASITQAALGIVFITAATLALTAGCAIIGARTGDELLILFDRSRSALILAGVCFAGLFLGGLMGIAATFQG